MRSLCLQACLCAVAAVCLCGFVTCDNNEAFLPTPIVGSANEARPGMKVKMCAGQDTCEYVQPAAPHSSFRSLAGGLIRRYRTAKAGHQIDSSNCPENADGRCPKVIQVIDSLPGVPVQLPACMMGESTEKCRQPRIYRKTYMPAATWYKEAPATPAQVLRPHCPCSRRSQVWNSPLSKVSVQLELPANPNADDYPYSVSQVADGKKQQCFCF
eukprot:gnl/Hemi2/1842_TR650_c0_g1_i1.p1 gnl/Hemi2/1842_TR650_c0_g1~~gnl/Hemi2/1842_TR650_c0_g1_i1.p1  ORF type:complete len:213 (+),score=6.43 gnl/Hemi2/1842_TR650_c0_g1_i1:40-678(+)